MKKTNPHVTSTQKIQLKIHERPRNHDAISILKILTEIFFTFPRFVQLWLASLSHIVHIWDIYGCDA